eukprot:GEMP01005764.1.p1 GENE.GEMP01005764.1~~GEMP01005764.1.p1  ORF type:complete len:838 (+),score=190.18 GEMP01005764.1:118-2631(+)
MTQWYRGPVLCCAQKDDAIFFGMGPVLYRTHRTEAESTFTVEPLPGRVHLHGLALCAEGILAYGYDNVALVDDETLRIKFHLRASGWILSGTIVDCSVILIYVEGHVEWRTMAGDVTKSVRLPTSINYTAAFSAQGIAVAGPLGIIHVWKECGTRALEGHQGAVIAIAWSHGDWERGLLLSGGDDRCVRLWSNTADELMHCRGHLGKVTGVCFLGPPRVCSVGEDQKVIIWANALQEKAIELTGPLRCVSYHTMLVVGGDCGARQIDVVGVRFVRNQWTLPKKEGSADWVRNVFWFGRCAVVCTNFGAIYVVDTATAQNTDPTIIRTISLGVIITAAAQMDGIIYVGTACGHLYRVDVDTGQYALFGSPMTMRVYCIFALAGSDGATCVVAVTDRALAVQRGTEVAFQLENAPKKLVSAAMSKHFLLFGDDVGYLWALDLRARSLQSIKAHPNARVLSVTVQLCAEQEQVVTTGADGFARRFVVGSLEPLEAVKAPRSLNQVVRQERECIAGFSGADFVLLYDNQEVLRVRCGGSRRPWALSDSFMYVQKSHVIWHVRDGNIEDRRLGPDVPHVKDIYATLSTPYGLVTCGEDTKVCLNQKSTVSTACVHPSTVRGLAWDATTGVLYSCGAKGRLHMYRMLPRTLVPRGDGVVWDEEGRLMAVGVVNGEPVCISSRGFIRRGAIVQKTQDDACPLCLCIDPSAQRIYVGTSVGRVEIFASEDLRPLGSWHVHEGAITAVLSLSHLVSMSDDGTVACSNKSTGERTAVVAAHAASGRALLEVPGGRICTVGWDQKLRIFAFPALQLLQTAQVAVTQPECLAWDDGVIVGGRGLERIIV